MSSMEEASMEGSNQAPVEATAEDEMADQMGTMDVERRMVDDDGDELVEDEGDYMGEDEDDEDDDVDDDVASSVRNSVPRACR